MGGPPSGGTADALFVAVNKAGRVSSFSRMTPKTIYKMLTKRAKRAPHDLRCTFKKGV
jgi:hypothetical protein